VLVIDVARLETLLAVGGLLLLAGVMASKLSSRLGVPALLAFLALGMLIGSDGPGGIAFDDPLAAQGVGIVALAFILFAGGLDTRWEQVRPVLRGGLLLSTVGVVVTAVVTGLAAGLVLGVPLELGLLVGAAVSSTDAAAVFSVLGSRSVGLRQHLRPLLELESGSNDPMAILLTVGLLEWIVRGGFGAEDAIRLLVQQLALGMVGGALVAALLAWVLGRVRLDQQGLYPVVTVAGVVLTYATVSELGGSGFLAVYIVGLILGQADLPHRRRLMDFHDAVAWLMQIVLFLVLGMLVFPSQLPAVAVPAVAILVVLTFVARPLAVAICLPFGWSLRERALVSWVGLRGAAPILLATFPLVAGIDVAGTVFDVVFFVVFLSVLLQGTSIPAVARRLGVDAPLGPPRPLAVEGVQRGSAALDLAEVEVVGGSTADGLRIIDLELPDRVLVVLLRRGDDHVIPQGSTTVEAGDALVLVGPADDLAEVRTRFGG